MGLVGFSVKTAAERAETTEDTESTVPADVRNVQEGGRQPLTSGRLADNENNGGSQRV